MDAALGKFYYIFTTVFCVQTINAVPPDACFVNFRWDDCGMPPQPVMYYWKPGSRCEIGIWRGCLPNPNMFHDEYECINTCIFVARAQPEDYHAHQEPDEYPEELLVGTADGVTDYGNLTDVNATQSSNDTDVTGGDGATGTDGEGGETPAGDAEGGDTPAAEDAEAPEAPAEEGEGGRRKLNEI